MDVDFFGCPARGKKKDLKSAYHSCFAAIIPQRREKDSKTLLWILLLLKQSGSRFPTRFLHFFCNSLFYTKRRADFCATRQKSIFCKKSGQNLVGNLHFNCYRSRGASQRETARNSNIVAFFFGDFVKSEDILALEETDAEPEEVVATPFAVKPLEPSAEDYQYVGYDFTKMSGTSTIDQKLKTYWNSRENVIAALTWTNLSDIKPLMKMDHAIMTSAKVSVVRTDFELNQNVNRAAFDRWYNFEDEKNNADLNTVFAEVFLSLGYIGEIGGTAYDIVMNGDLSSAADSNGQWRYYTVISNKNGMHYDETPLPIAAVCDTTLAGNYSITVTTQTTYAFTFDLGTLYHTTGIADDTHNYYISE